MYSSKVPVHGHEGECRIEIVIILKNLDSSLEIPVPEHLDSPHICRIHLLGLDELFHHSLAVHVEIEIHGPELRIESILHISVIRGLLHRILAAVKTAPVLRCEPEICRLLFLRQVPVIAYKGIEKLPGLRCIGRNHRNVEDFRLAVRNVSVLAY